MKAKRTRAAKSRAPEEVSTAKLVDTVERERWPEIEEKITAARASIAKGKGRKWSLARVLADSEKRRRTSKAAAE